MSVFLQFREISASPEAVFAAIQDPERLARWWGPYGFRSTFHTFEFKRGGRWLFTMHGPDGTDYENESTFLEIVPNSRVRIDHLSLPHFKLTITLESDPQGTLVTWLGEFENSEFAEKMRNFLETMNEQNLNRLALEVRGTAEGSPDITL
jgi:uncharacterized protein YndB with AHSA1/START domain